VLGSLYQHGTGVPQDQQQAIKLYTTAADKGVFEAQAYLAGAYLAGNGVQKDAAQAANGCSLPPRTAMLKRNVILQFSIRPESAVPQSYKDAVFWYQKAAEPEWASAHGPR
jgi:TPR repeat protein